MAWGHLLRHAATGSPEEMRRAIACLDWLVANPSPTRAGLAWGNHFDFSTRSGRMPAHAPTIVWSGLIGQAFLQAFEQTGDQRHLAVAEGICEWILKLPREKTDRGTCLSYVDYEQFSIHNSSMLGAALLAQTWRHTGRTEFADVAAEAVDYTVARQRDDGSWLYGEEPSYQWIDNFHTGYVLDSLKRFIEATGRQEHRPALIRGYGYFKRTFFDAEGRPAYYPGRAFPIDIQCAAQAIDTFALFAEEDPEALEYAVQVATWTIEHMRDRTGYFYYRTYPGRIAKTPYFHWGQATMFKALSHLLLRLGERPVHSSLVHPSRANLS
jgi:rhamnogalacturonyl hydrolase YesR